MSGEGEGVDVYAVIIGTAHWMRCVICVTHSFAAGEEQEEGYKQQLFAVP